MRKITILFLGVCWLLVGAGAIYAQEQAQQQGVMAPPKVLTIIREYVKPGKSGALHEQAEARFVQAFARAKWSQHYVALTSVSGPSRAIFLTGYDSLEAWEKDQAAEEKNTVLAAELDRAGVADGELLSSTDTATFLYREELSYHAPVDIAHMRYIAITVVHARIGHSSEFQEIVKLFNDARNKISSDAHIACYQLYAGGPITTYLFFSPLKSMAEADKAVANSKAFDQALGEEGQKKLTTLSDAAVESVERQLLAFSPRMSYPSDEFVKADPDFWKQKPTRMIAATPSAEKKAQTKPASLKPAP